MSNSYVTYIYIYITYLYIFVHAGCHTRKKRSNLANPDLPTAGSPQRLRARPWRLFRLFPPRARELGWSLNSPICKAHTLGWWRNIDHQFLGRNLRLKFTCFTFRKKKRRYIYIYWWSTSCKHVEQIRVIHIGCMSWGYFPQPGRPKPLQGPQTATAAATAPGWVGLVEIPIILVGS